jgi:exopolysaccharide biosynthesis polyprenyl glycosylphosphotransferase
MTAVDFTAGTATWTLATDHLADDRQVATITAPRSSEPLMRRLTWERQYRRRVLATDILVVAAAATGASLLHLDVAAPGALAADPWVLARIPFATALAWLVTLSIFRTRVPSIIGSGHAEYKRVVLATAVAFGALSIVFLIFQWQGLRAQLIVALPLGLIAVLATRRGWRAWLRSRRRRGSFVSRAVVVGRRADVVHVVDAIQRDDQLGFHVVGTTLDGGDSATELVVRSARYPVSGSPATVAGVARELEADTIILASQHEDIDFVRRLRWELEGTAAELVLFSHLTDVAGPRISLSQVQGLPLVQVRIPTFDDARRVSKRVLDVVVAACALVPLGLITPIIALLIALDSPGGVFFRQRRVGVNGHEFEMLKFRTMRVTAEDELATLVADAPGVLFKMKADPRVTRVGRFLRRFSLDEFPQFWNVLRGDMSVVGPRPPLPREVREYEAHTNRRLYIKPGITGLWQVSGRSDLSWEESVRLDLHYVENWSMSTDLSIIARTAGSIIRPRGAY